MRVLRGEGKIFVYIYTKQEKGKHGKGVTKGPVVILKSTMYDNTTHTDEIMVSLPVVLSCSQM